MFNKVVVANRGAVAARVLRALNEMGIRSVAVYSEADAGAPYLELASETHAIGPAPARASYLDQNALIEVLRKSHADGLHPGYGFLSENAAFAQRVTETGARFIGPSPRWIEAMGHKTRARELAAGHGMPMAKGSGVLPADSTAILAAARCDRLPGAGEAGGRRRRYRHAAGKGRGRAPRRGRALALHGRPRIRQRGGLSRAPDRAPAPRRVPGAGRRPWQRGASLRARLLDAAAQPEGDRGSAGSWHHPRASRRRRRTDRQIMRRLGYDNIGTVEMLMGADGSFSFLEMNTRLQVEHGVTEEVTGVDLVKAQIRSAAGEKLSSILPEPIEVKGHAIQARVYAEDPKNFLSFAGKIEGLPAAAGPACPHRDWLCRGPGRDAPLRSDDRQGDRSRRNAGAGGRQPDRGVGRLSRFRGSSTTSLRCSQCCARSRSARGGCIPASSPKCSARVENSRQDAKAAKEDRQ